jgi:hypothetical protein
VGVVDEGVLRDGVAMVDLRGLVDPGRAGEEECRCCLLGLGRRGEALCGGGGHCELEGYARTGNWSWDLGGD